MERSFETDHEIHDLLKTRWSPRSFASRPVETEKLLSLLEAARWSPSGGNQQPWAFIVAGQFTGDTHRKLVETMMGRNPAWAKDAPVLILAAAKLQPAGGARNRFAYYDVGQAVAHLSVQANALGLHVHQMAGFDAGKAGELFGLPDDYEPMTIIAIGYLGEPEALPDDLREREVAARTRKPLSDFVFASHWGEPLELVPEPERAG